MPSFRGAPGRREPGIPQLFCSSHFEIPGSRPPASPRNDEHDGLEPSCRNATAFPTRNLPGRTAAMIILTDNDVLPDDGAKGTLVGRVWRPEVQGPAVVAVRTDGVFDVTSAFPPV